MEKTMTDRVTQHATFTIERKLPVAPARAFQAWADPNAKARWFQGPHDKWKELERKQDFRIGGKERVRGAHAAGSVSAFDAIYLDIVKDRRIIYAYDMYLDDRKISVSLATVDFLPEGAATRMRFTEQAAFVDGYDDAGSREKGTGGLMDQLEASLRK